MKCDPSVKNVQKEALSVIAKATELFIEYVSKKSGIIASQRGVRTVKMADFVNAVHESDVLEFLAEDFPVSSLKVRNKKRNVEAGGEDASQSDHVIKKSKQSGNAEIATGRASLLSYFGNN